VTGYAGWFVDTGWDGFGSINDPSWKKIDYSDIEAIFKAQPSSYHVEEKRYPDGRFKSFTVETR